MKFKHLPVFAAVLISGTVCAENLIHNGDFQLGNSGFSIERWQRPDTNPEMTFHPLVTEDDPRSPGRKILKIDNSYKEQCFVYGCETRLEAGKTYFLRGEIRSSGSKVPTEFSMIYLNRKIGRNAQGGTVVAEKEWKRFEIPVRTQKFGGMYHLKITLDQPADPGTVFLSGLSLSSEKDTAFHGVEIGFRTASRVFFHGERAMCAATLRKETLKLVAIDDYSGVRRTILERPLRVPSGGVEEIVFDLPVDRFGSFRIEPEDSSIRFFPGYYAVIGKVEPLRFDPKRYSFGVNDTAQLKWRKGKAPGYVASNASVREELRLLSLAGCRLIRAFTGMGIDWMLLEPEPGKFNYLYLDTTLKLYEFQQPFDIGRGVAVELGGEIIAEVELPDDLVDIALIDRDPGKSALHEGLLHLIRSCVKIEGNHLGTVGHHFARSGVVEFKHILNHPLFVAFNGPVFLSDVDHHADLLLAHLLFAGGLDSEEFQEEIDGSVQHPDERGGDFRQKVDRTGDMKGNPLRVPQTELFREQFSEYQGDVGEQDGNCQHHQRIECGVAEQGEAMLFQPEGYRIGKALRCERAGHEAGKRDTYLDCRQKTSGILNQCREPPAAAAAFAAEPPYRGRLERDQCNFRRGEKCIQSDQKKQKQQLENQ